MRRSGSFTGRVKSSLKGYLLGFCWALRSSACDLFVRGHERGLPTRSPTLALSTLRIIGSQLWMHIGGCDYSKWAETTIFVSVDVGGCAYRNGTFVPPQIRTTGLTANALPS